MRERCPSGRRGRSRKPLSPLRGSEGSNPSLSARWGGVPERPKGRDWKSRVRDKTRTEGSNPSPSAIFSIFLLILFPFFLLGAELEIKGSVVLLFRGTSKVSAIDVKDIVILKGNRLMGKELSFYFKDGVLLASEDIDDKKLFLLPVYLSYFLFIKKLKGSDVKINGKRFRVLGDFLFDDRSIAFSGSFSGNNSYTEKGAFYFNGGVEKGDRVLKFNYKGRVRYHTWISKGFGISVELFYKELKGMVVW